MAHLNVSCTSAQHIEAVKANLEGKITVQVSPRIPTHKLAASSFRDLMIRFPISQYKRREIGPIEEICLHSDCLAMSANAMATLVTFALHVESLVALAAFPDTIVH